MKLWCQDGPCRGQAVWARTHDSSVPPDGFMVQTFKRELLDVFDPKVPIEPTVPLYLYRVVNRGGRIWLEHVPG